MSRGLMAVWYAKCGDAVVRIKDYDHHPPHCHVRLKGRDIKVTLHDLVVRSSVRLPHAVMRYLRENQEQMLQAWDNVVVAPTGGAWEFEE